MLLGVERDMVNTLEQYLVADLTHPDGWSLI